MTEPLFLSVLDSWLGPKLFAAAVLLYAAWRIRTVKQIFGGVVATMGMLGTIGAAVLVTYGVALGFGWVDVYPGEIAGDLSEAGRTAWQFGGDWVVSALKEVVPGGG